ncbi:hypothetical protein CDO52_07115 [Nocardiopsis gilva YIM 90087]|uniref:Uncharacterized protein n=1 Tax=Nocardiopsis gilva YIM 90087 TaxID=1235441 RepID=A0A223S388_9ACTN|nr:hypothetical protein CDO52_07115 [Nocardiopsis gilva YIM 90087]
MRHWPLPLRAGEAGVQEQEHRVDLEGAFTPVEVQVKALPNHTDTASRRSRASSDFSLYAWLMDNQ